MEKKCLHCDKLFKKPSTRSVKDFLTRAKYCSNSCKVYDQKNFYKHWAGKKRPDLVKTKAFSTMFRKGVGGYCPPEKIFKKHGMSNTRIYNIWRAMGQRCKNPNNLQYKDYGGRGIKIEWTSFEDFYRDMYEDYLRHEKKHGFKNTTIDRIDNDGNYCKVNCRWATKAEQMMNTRRTKI